MTTDASAPAERFTVVTGGPGSGKSTLIERLRAAGYSGTDEAGRGVIRDQTAIGGSAVPWVDAALFAEAMLSWEMRSYRLAAVQRGPVFFDRGLPDIVAHLTLVGRPVPAHIRAAAQRLRYRPRVFVAPPWQEIYEQGAERRPPFAEAKRTWAQMVETYADCGYEPIELPCVSVEERAGFVLREM